jgi:hypothetical protein
MESIGQFWYQMPLGGVLGESLPQKLWFCENQELTVSYISPFQV